MIKLTDCICVGNSKDEAKAVEHVQNKVMDRVLVVAHDMVPANSWRNKIEYMHVGLVDGPGNLLAVYHAAVLALAVLARKGKVMVCCHEGGRSLAVAIMYLYLIGDGPSWDEAVARLTAKERELPQIHDAHRKAFFLMDWGMLSRVLTSEVS